MTIRAPEQVREYSFPRGYAGTVKTVKLMCEKLAERHTDQRLRARTRELFAGLLALDDLAEIRAVWNFIVANVRYVKDPLGAEHITDPLELDKEIDEGAAAEDCESLALYAATLFAASGRQSQFTIIEADPARPGVFTHCALRVATRRDGWIDFDPVGVAYFPNSFSLGDSLERPGQLVEHWNLDGERVDHVASQATRGAFFGDAGSESDPVDTVATGASSFGPWGALVGGLLKGGEAVYELATAKNKKPGSTITDVSSAGGKANKIAAGKALVDKGKPDAPSSSEMSTGTKVGIGVAVGAGLYMLTRRRRSA